MTGRHRQAGDKAWEPLSASGTDGYTPLQENLAAIHRTRSSFAALVQLHQEASLHMAPGLADGTSAPRDQGRRTAGLVLAGPCCYCSVPLL